ncbi:suppressor protein stp22 of temperature-sensitive alpha-factor receptor and arginine permease, partial [Massospora cicadina]
IYPQHGLVIPQLESAIRSNPALSLHVTPTGKFTIYMGSAPALSVSKFSSPLAYLLAASPTPLARLRGTVEVNYFGNHYNIPVVVWLPSSFPSTPPIALVEPTPQMEIQVSSFINQDGYFCHPYLQGWYNHPTPSLVELLHIMRHIFGKTPPLLTRASPTCPAGEGGSLLPSEKNQGPKNSLQPASNSHPFQVAKPPASSNTALSPASQSLLDSDNPIGDISQLQYKLYLRLHQAFEHFNLRNDKLRLQLEYENQQLNRNANRVRVCMGQLHQIRGQCDANLAILRRASADLNHTIERLSQTPKVEIECLQLDKHPLIKQLTDLVARDNSFEDTYYHLGRALSLQIIDLRAYLRSVRALAHDQFMARALIVKIKSQLAIPRPAEAPDGPLRRALAFSALCLLYNDPAAPAAP